MHSEVSKFVVIRTLHIFNVCDNFDINSIVEHYMYEWCTIKYGNNSRFVLFYEDTENGYGDHLSDDG